MRLVTYCLIALATLATCKVDLLKVGDELMADDYPDSDRPTNTHGGSAKWIRAIDQWVDTSGGQRYRFQWYAGGYAINDPKFVDCIDWKESKCWGAVDGWFGGNRQCWQEDGIVGNIADVTFERGTDGMHRATRYANCFLGKEREDDGLGYMDDFTCSTCFPQHEDCPKC